MSLLSRVKEGIKKRRANAKQQGEIRKAENKELQAKIHKARLEGYVKGAEERAKRQGYLQGKAGVQTGSGALGTLGKIGGAANRGLAYLNDPKNNPFDMGTPELESAEKKKRGKKRKKAEKPVKIFNPLDF